jgi:hypothetical protein
MTQSTAVRIALGYLTAMALLLGVWAVLAPRGFYDNFPGFGRAWVSVDGPYNEHLIRDVGALNLALAVVLIVAAVRLTPDLIMTAALASLAWSVPHLLYHLFNSDDLTTSDTNLSIGGLALACVIPALLLRFRNVK